MPSCFGSGVALSSDGDTALIGGQGDQGGTGAAWLYARSGTSWAAQGGRLTGQGENLVGTFGHSVALAADGQTALIGGNNDNNAAGAVWVFSPPSPSCANAAASAPAGGGTVALSLPCSDPAGAALSYAIVSGPAHGTLGPVGSGGQVSYSSNGGYLGPDAFTYRVTDEWGVATSSPVTANATSGGWTVTATGHLSVVDPQEATGFARTLPLRPWAPHSDQHLIRLGIESLEGRRLLAWAQRPHD